MHLLQHTKMAPLDQNGMGSLLVQILRTDEEAWQLGASCVAR
jgi:hypothetical protein